MKNIQSTVELYTLEIFESLMDDMDYKLDKEDHVAFLKNICAYLVNGN